MATQGCVTISEIGACFARIRVRWCDIYRGARGLADGVARRVMGLLAPGEFFLLTAIVDAGSNSDMDMKDVAMMATARAAIWALAEDIMRERGRWVQVLNETVFAIGAARIPMKAFAPSDDIANMDGDFDEA